MLILNSLKTIVSSLDLHLAPAIFQAHSNQALFSTVLSTSVLSESLMSSLVVVAQSLSCVWLFVTHGLQHTRLYCPSPSPGVCWSSCPLSQWCHPSILSSVAPFSSCLQSFPASGSFPVSQLFTSGGPSIIASVSSVLPMNIQGGFPLGLNGLILAVQGSLKSLLQHHSLKTSVLWCSVFFIVQLSHPYMTTRKTII